MRSLGTTVLTGLLLALPPLRTSSAGEPETALPSSTLACLSIDVGRAVRELPRLELVRLFEDEEVEAFLEGAVEYAKRQTRQPRAALKLLEMYGLPDVVRGRVVVAVVGVGRLDAATGQTIWSTSFAGGEAPTTADVVAIVETNGAEAFGAALERALELIPEERRTDEVAHENFPHRRTRYESLGPELPGFSHGFVGDTFLLTTNPARYVETAAALAAEERQTESFADDDAFAAWRERASRGQGLLDVYVNLRPVWESLRAPSPADDASEGAGENEALADLRRVGLTSLEGVGVSVGVEDGRLRDSIAVVTGARREGVFALLGALHPGGAVDDVPRDVDLVAAANVDLGELFDRFSALLGELDPEERAKMDASLAEASAVLGVDVRQELLRSLGDRMALWSTAKAGPLPIPDAGASITLTDGARASELLGRLIEGIELGPDVAIRPFELEGATAAWSSSGAMLVSPAWAIVGDRLLAATNGPLLRRTMQANGAAGVVADADFARCLAHNVGSAGDDVAAVFYLDLARVAEVGLATAGPFLPSLALQAPFELDPTLMPLPDTVSSYLSGYLLTLRVDDRVVALDASSPFGGLILATSTLALAQWSIDEYEEKRALERERLLKPR